MVDRSWIIIAFSLLVPVGQAPARTDPPLLEWVKRVGISAMSFSNDEVVDLQMDADGNLYVTGMSQGDGTEFDFLTYKLTNNGDVVWSVRYDGPYHGHDVPSSLCVDDFGNVYVTGSSTGDTTHSDIVTIKYDSGGVLRWIGRYDGPVHWADGGIDIVVDNLGSAYVAGFQTSGSTYSHDFVTIKYGPFGEEEWVAIYDGPVGLTDDPVGLILNELGHLIVAGRSATGQSAETELFEYVAISYDQHGVEQWIYRHDMFEDVLAIPADLAITPSGGVGITGMVRSPFPLESMDILTIQLSAEGTLQWAQRFGSGWEPDGSSELIDRATEIEINQNGDIFVLGTVTEFWNNLPLGDSLITMKYSSTGALQWVSSLASHDHQTLTGDLAVNDGGVAVIATEGVWENWPQRGQSIVVYQYDESGSVIWEESYSGEQEYVNATCALQRDGSVYVAGSEGPDGQAEFLVMKYEEGGTGAWQVHASGPGSTPGFVRGAVVDGEGNVVVASVGVDVRGNKDWIIQKVSPSGQTVWSNSYDGTAGRSDQPSAMVIDAAGHTYVCGRSDGIGSGSDYLTIRYDPLGNPLWIVRHDSTMDDRPYVIALDSTGYVYVAGNTSVLKYGSDGSLIWQVPSQGLVTALVIDNSGFVYTTGYALEGSSDLRKYDPSGALLWTNPSLGNALALDSAGFLYVLQYYRITKLDSSGSELWTIPVGGDEILIFDNEHIYLSAVDWVHCVTSGGDQLWSRSPYHFSATDSDIDVDRNGNLYMTGWDWEWDWGSNDISIQTVKYDANGTLLWKVRYQGDHTNGEPRAGGIAVNDVDELYVVGEIIGRDYASMPVVLKYGGGTTAVGEDPGSNLPTEFRLFQNYPNPFNAQTTLRFEIGDVGYVKLEIFDPLGRRVATVVDEELAPGSYTRRWDATGVSSGVYFYRLHAGNFSETRKLMLLR